MPGIPRLALVMASIVCCAATLAQEKGRIKIDGSSTVAPITMAAAELYRQEQPAVQVTVGVSGTGGGFKKFLEEKPELRTDINNASRPIRPTELSRAKELGIEFLELPIAYDGIAVIVNQKNTFCDDLTLAELRKIWEPGSSVKSWKDIRAGFPDLPLRLYGPGPDSGTFDYFVEVVMGDLKGCRNDYTASENDNVLVQGVAGDAGGLGYFGYSYYEVNAKKLKLLAIDGGDGKKVAPNAETIRTQTYHPLSRPLFLYVNKGAAARPEVKSFVGFLLGHAKAIVEHKKVNYVALSDELYQTIRDRMAAGTTGTLFADPATHTRSLTQIYLGSPATP